MGEKALMGKTIIPYFVTLKPYSANKRQEMKGLVGDHLYRPIVNHLGILIHLRKQQL